MKRTKNKYSYQIPAASNVLDNAFSKNYGASVLAATPGAGKTTISHICINKFVLSYPSSRIVVLTEGQTPLKNQYLDELDNANVEINFTYGEFGSGAQVQVGLPQSIHNLTWDEIDLLIVDEAHNFYFATMVQNIIRKYKVKHQILMTGSPSEFNYRNSFQKTFGMTYISVEDLKKKGVFSGVDMDVFRTEDRKNPHRTIKELIKFAKKQNYDLSKMMIACPSIQYAKSVKDYLTVQGRKVSLSTSDSDKDNKAIAAFKAGETDTLVVVNKGILGFNDKEITFLADLKSSPNLDSSNQLFSRVLRTHPEDKRKAYVRAASGSKDYNKQVIMLHKIVALMDKKFFKAYNGKNLSIKMAA